MKQSELYQKLKEAGFEVKVFRWQRKDLHTGAEETEVSLTRQDLDAQTMRGYERDCIISATSRNGTVSVTAGYHPEIDGKGLRPIWEIDIKFPCDDPEFIDFLEEGGIPLGDKHGNIYEMMYPEDGESWIQLPNQKNAVATVEKKIPKTTWQAAKQLIELGQPVDEFFGITEKTYCNAEELWTDLIRWKRRPSITENLEKIKIETYPKTGK